MTLASQQAAANTAVYVEPDEISDGDLFAISTEGDEQGFLLGLNETFAIVLDTPFSVNTRDRVSIFTLSPPTGVARGQVRFGSYNNGSPIIIASRNFRSGNTVNVNNLLQTGCQLLGGCDYIEITTTRTRRGAAGVEVDYVVVDGQVVEIASPSPEPSTWALMIIAFVGIAARLKTARPELMRRKAKRAKLRVANRKAFHSLAGQARAGPQTAHP